MREIKFRAYIGYYEKSKNTDARIKEFYLYEITTKLQDEIDGWGIVQYTGLKDKNGKDIYEGDIVKFDGHTNEDKFTADIIFHKGKFCDSYYRYEIGKYREVIGNIYENPELLKEK